MDKITEALDLIADLGGVDGDHHKQWVLDQVVRILLDCPVERRSAKDYKGQAYEYDALGESEEYVAWVEAYCDGEDGPDTYSWDEGVAP